MCLASLAFASAQTREEVLQYWTKERLAGAKERPIVLDPVTGDSFDIEYVGNDGLYKLVLARVAPRTPVVQVESPSVGRQRNLEDGLTLSAPNEGETFFNPRTVIFKASVASASRADVSYSFVFEHDSTETSVIVAAEEIDSTGIASEMVGGFHYGNWTWRLEGTDAQNNVVDASVQRTFTISGSGFGERRLQTVVPQASWEFGGQVQNTVGKIFFTNRFLTEESVVRTADSACSGTLIKDNNTDISLILTAAHCLYSELLEGTFSWNVVFIPDYDNSPVSRNTSCVGYPCGCWTPSGAVALQEYNDFEFPFNLMYDYSFFIVKDVGDHGGTTCNGTEADEDYALDEAINATVFGNVGTAYLDDFTYALGYQGLFDRDLKYCAEISISKSDFIFDNGVGTYGWLAGCFLMGGTSGGGWFQNMNEATGQGVVVALNSFGFKDSGTVLHIFRSSLTRCSSPS